MLYQLSFFFIQLETNSIYFTIIVESIFSINILISYFMACTYTLIEIAPGVLSSLLEGCNMLRPISNLADNFVRAIRRKDE